MKVLIVFLAILIINISFLVHQGDLGRYLRLQSAVKAMAEECGAGAALYYDPAAYSEGSLVAVPAEALAHAEAVLQKGDGLVCDQIRKLSGWRMVFFDDSGQCRSYYNGIRSATHPFTYPYYYTDPMGKQIIVDSPSVIVTLELETNDLFRLSSSSAGTIVRSAMYELRPQGR